jgi:hypothetical protein
LSIIWIKGVSSGLRGYHLGGKYHLNQGVSSEYNLERGYNLDQRGIIWIERVSSEYHLIVSYERGIIWIERVSSGAGVSSGSAGYHLD